MHACLGTSRPVNRHRAVTFVRDLLLPPVARLPVNLVFLRPAWAAASSYDGSWVRARLRRHPFPVEARFRNCLTLTYAVPADVLKPTMPPGLELETVDGRGFVAVALVQAESLRPAGLPRVLGQDIFVAAYRAFTRFRCSNGQTLRGLRILRSDADRAQIVFAGNLLTHYNYHQCHARVVSSDGRLRFGVCTRDGRADLEVTANLSDSSLPAGSPFSTAAEARPFAGPLPFTVDYEAETHAIVAIEATRAHWNPAPVRIEGQRIAFFDDPMFGGCRPVLAAAFHAKDVEYRWERGTHYPLP
jgi:hypothetical protein